MADKEIFAELCAKLNTYDQEQIRMDMFVLGTAFVKLDHEGNVQRVRPDNVYNQYLGEKK